MQLAAAATIHDKQIFFIRARSAWRGSDWKKRRIAPMTRRRRLCIVGNCRKLQIERPWSQALEISCCRKRGGLVRWVVLSPDIELESTIYEADVIAIINSIILADGNSLNHLQLPKKWRSLSIST
mmetsp:Transcript_8487/g.14891  ORF Transcript_8487/g.14891 Transcript_8487/m.14891 type:complete len:125 (-) Transcript_8487:274-648(-)